MSYTLMNHTNTNYIDKDLNSTILDYLLKDHTVVLNSDFVFEGYLETLFENIRDDLLRLVHHGDISYGRLQKALANLVTKSSIEGKNFPNSSSVIMIHMHMLASVEVC